MNGKNLESTYCNPLVLPDYPTLPVLGKGPYDTIGVWDRGGRTPVSERQIFWEAAGRTEPMPELHAAPPAGPDYCREAENDVRSTADPTCLYHEGVWYLYCSGGPIYRSEDFIRWTAHSEPSWTLISRPMAPTVAFFRGKFYAASNSVPLHEADSPLGPWRAVGDWTLPDGREFLANDPMIFRDEDDSLYLYWGSGTGILGAKLDGSHPNRLLTAPANMLKFNGNNAWERVGSNNENWGTGSLEGSWMYKRGSVYYLTYAAAGTEYYSYCMGAYVGRAPLGPFAPQKRNPVSRSDRGLIRGGGHGSIADGPGGTIWCFYTIPVAADSIFERRIGMDPCGIDGDGCLYARTGCDTPQYAPGVLEHPELGNETGLVSCAAFALTMASSYAPGHRPLYAVDEVLHTWWQPAAGDSEPSLAVYMRGRFYVSGIRLIWKDVGLDLEKGVLPGPYRYVIEGQRVKGSPWFPLLDASGNETDLSVDYRTFPEEMVSGVRVRITGAPEGLTPGILNLTVFGESADRRETWGKAPIFPRR